MRAYASMRYDEHVVVTKSVGGPSWMQAYHGSPSHAAEGLATSIITPFGARSYNLKKFSHN